MPQTIDVEVSTDSVGARKLFGGLEEFRHV